jgi:hypothetical protein
MNLITFSIAIIIYIMLISSCTTPKIMRELQVVEKSDPVNQVVNLIQNKCFQSKQPQFLADIRSNNTKMLPFNLEAIWENNYNLLKASAIGPLGEEYLSFDIIKHEFKYYGYPNLQNLDHNFKQITSLLAKIGAKELRNFLCGQYAFQIFSKNDGVFIVKEKLTEEQNLNYIPKKEKIEKNSSGNKKYFSISTIDISDHNIEVQSYVSLTKNKNGYAVIVDSRFYYGPFTSDADVEIKWIGFVNSDGVFPTSTVFRTNNGTFGVNILDYQ